MRTARLLSLVVVTVLLFASVPVGAQQPVAPPPPQIPYGAPISLEQAKKVMAGAEAEAYKQKWNMVIAVHFCLYASASAPAITFLACRGRGVQAKVEHGHRRPRFGRPP